MPLQRLSRYEMQTEPERPNTYKANSADAKNRANCEGCGLDD